jgi:hypothetical protein
VATWDDANRKPGFGADAGAVPVTAMIAVEEYWERYAERPIDEKISNFSCFRLVYGMPSATTQNAHDSAKWVNKIDIMLVGSPPDDWGINDDDDFLGSKDDNDDTGTGNGGGSQDGDGYGDGQGPGNSDTDSGNGASSNASGSDKLVAESSIMKEITLSSGETIKGEELSQAEMLSMVALAGGGGSGSDKPWTAYEISKESVPMLVPPPDAKVIVLVAGSLVAAFILGALQCYWDFNPPRGRRRKAGAVLS